MNFSKQWRQQIRGNGSSTSIAGMVSHCCLHGNTRSQSKPAISPAELPDGPPNRAPEHDADGNRDDDEKDQHYWMLHAITSPPPLIPHQPNGTGHFAGDTIASSPRRRLKWPGPSYFAAPRIRRHLSSPATKSCHQPDGRATENTHHDVSTEEQSGPQQNDREAQHEGKFVARPGSFTQRDLRHCPAVSPSPVSTTNRYPRRIVDMRLKMDEPGLNRLFNKSAATDPPPAYPLPCCRQIPSARTPIPSAPARLRR